MADTNARAIVQTMMDSKGLTLSNLASLMRDKNDKPLSVQNLSNKLQRDSIKFSEIQEIADICGFSIEFKQQPESQQAYNPNYRTASTIVLDQINLDPGNDDLYLNKMREGLSFVELPFLGTCLLAGKNADKAAQFAYEIESLSRKHQSQDGEAPNPSVMILNNKKMHEDDLREVFTMTYVCGMFQTVALYPINFKDVLDNFSLDDLSRDEITDIPNN